MLSTEILPKNAKRNPVKKQRSRPLLQSGVCSRVIDPLPPSPSTVRHEALPGRSRKTGKLSYSSSSSTYPSGKHSSKNFKKESFMSLRNLGLEVEPEKLVWLNWDPGEEYTLNLVLKNVCLRLLKIRYASPSTQFFSTLFPHLIALSPGTSVTLPVTFRPLTLEVYEDKISFTTQNDLFDVALQGLFHQYSIQIPESIHFGFSAINLYGQLNFQIRNTSELITNFSWDVPKPFHIVPSNGVLQPKSAYDFKAAFCPSSAVVFKVTAVCRYGLDLKEVMTLDGIGKFPYIVVSPASKLTPDNYDQKGFVNFGNVAIHSTVKKDIVLHNVTNVVADYIISTIPKMLQVEKVFSLKKKSGLIGALKKEKISIEYSPHTAHVTDISHYEVSIAGGVSKTNFECIGFCEGPKVIVSETLLDFGILQPKQTSMIKTMKITNQSNCDAVFQFDLDDMFGVFCVDITNGILSRGKSETIQFSFEPADPINYYRRAVLIVHEQGPLFLDLIGTKHTIDDRPPALLPEHLHRYRTLVKRGLSFYSPHLLQNQLREGKLALDDSSCPFVVEEIYEKCGNDFAITPILEYFDDGHHTETTFTPPHVSLDQIYIWMGRVKSSLWGTTVRLNNHTCGKVVATWMPDDSGLFKVLPSVAEIFPCKTTDFKVIFKSETPDQFIRRQLECYVSYKCLRDYRIVENTFVTPPWLLTLDIVGHTCNYKTTVYPPVSVHKQKLAFPPTLPDNGSYCTTVIENKGSSPVLYQMIKGHHDIVVKPPFGVITSKFQIGIMRYIPDKVGIFRDKLTIHFNADDKHNQFIEVVGTGEQPELLLKNDGELFFKPTCIYSVSTSEHEVQNISRLSFRYKWLIAKDDRQKLSVTPLEGLILPNQIQKYKWTFSPTYCADFQFVTHCIAWPEDQVAFVDGEYVGRDVKKFKLRITANCIRGEIRVEKTNIDFGSVVVGSTKTENIVLYNDFNCDLNFCLSLKQVIDNEYGEAPNKKEPIGLSLSTKSCIVPARSRLAIAANAHAHRRVIYTWFLYYKQLTSSGEVFPSSKQSLLCQLVAEGIYPTLRIIDVRSSDGGKSVTRHQLWKWFNIDNMNLCLDCDPDPAELVQNVAMKRRSSIKPNVYTKSVVTFNFGAAPMAAQSCSVNMTIKNTSSIACKWVFFFPDDLQMEVDPWAIDGLMDSNELHVTLIESNRLFTVQPRGGKLNPDEKCMISLSYKHDIVGTHRIPILFKIEKGKEILLEFVGMTLELGRRYLHFPEKIHSFSPVCIGEPLPPKQLYELHNGGSLPVTYHVDLFPLRDLEAENFDQKIFTCLNPFGIIPAEGSIALEWIFAPFESKSYEANIPIHVVDGDTAVITFKGAGYDRRYMGKSEPMSDRSLCHKLDLTIEERLIPPEQIVRLSCEYICLGNVPVYGRVRRVLFLTNMSESTPVYYTWRATSSVTNKIIRIIPVEGHIDPGRSVMCTITFCGVGPPSFFDITLMCEIVDLEKRAEFKFELEAWEKERERQAVEFCITSQTELPDFDKDSLLTSKASCRSSKKEHLENALNLMPDLHLVEDISSQHRFPSEFKTFQTLPPIIMEAEYGQRGRRESLQRHHDIVTGQNWVKPHAPKPSLLQLTVTARTHNANIYRQLFLDECDKHFIDRSMQRDQIEPAFFNCETDALENCCTNEQIMMKMMMTEIIRGLLDDLSFQESIRNLDNIPISYFKQLPRDCVDFEEDDARLNVLFMDEDSSNLNQRTSNHLISEILHQSGDPEISSIVSNTEKMSRPTEMYSDTHESMDEVELNQLFPVLSDEALKVHPHFGVILDDVLSEIVGNVMKEAVLGEVLLTTRPRIVALPPSSKPNLHIRVAFYVLSSYHPRDFIIHVTLSST